MMFIIAYSCQHALITYLRKFGPVHDVPVNSTKKYYGRVEMKLLGSILNDSFVSQCGKKGHNVNPLSFEENHQVSVK